jgi:hypothetical protein
MSKTITNTVLLTEIRNLTNLIQTHIIKDEKFQSTIEELLNGNGKPGLKTRVDRIEQIELSRKWSWKVAWTAIVGTAVGLIAKVIFG